jgi:hypothetical protein
MSIASTGLGHEAIWVSVEKWCTISGWGKTKTYEHLALRNLRAKKFGKKTLIHVPTGLTFIEGLPDAVMTTGLCRHSQTDAAD